MSNTKEDALKRTIFRLVGLSEDLLEQLINVTEFDCPIPGDELEEYQGIINAARNFANK